MIMQNSYAVGESAIHLPEGRLYGHGIDTRDTWALSSSNLAIFRYFITWSSVQNPSAPESYFKYFFNQV